MERDTEYSVHGLEAIDVVHSIVPPHLVYESGDCGRIFSQDLLLQLHDRWVLPKAASRTVVSGQKAWVHFLMTSSHNPGIIWGDGDFL